MLLGMYVGFEKKRQFEAERQELKQKIQLENTFFKKTETEEFFKKISKLIKKPADFVGFIHESKNNFYQKFYLIKCGRRLFEDILLNNAQTEKGNSAIEFIKILLKGDAPLEVKKTLACFNKFLKNSCLNNYDKKSEWLFNLLSAEENRDVLFKYAQNDDSLCEVLFNAINAHMRSSFSGKKEEDFDENDDNIIESCTEMQILLKDKVHNTTSICCKQLPN